jgi:hypothetical protein
VSTILDDEKGMLRYWKRSLDGTRDTWTPVIITVRYDGIIINLESLLLTP